MRNADVGLRNEKASLKRPENPHSAIRKPQSAVVRMSLVGGNRQPQVAGRQEVAGRYVLRGRREVGFAVGEYDAGRELVIDPVLTYATYLGGGGLDIGNGIAVDNSGNVYVTGRTDSTDFPTENELQGDQFNQHAFVTKGQLALRLYKKLFTIK